MTFTQGYKFSDDGRYILREDMKYLTLTETAEPIVFSLSRARLGAEARSCPDRRQPEADAKDSTELAQTSGSEELLLRGSVVMEAGQSLSIGSDTYGLDFSSGNNLQTLETVRQGNGTRTNQHLFSLPDSWCNLGDTIHASVNKSSLRENHPGIPINHTSRPWYSPEQLSHEADPILVRKHLGAMLPPETTVLGIESDAGTKRRLDLNESASHQPQPKQQRLIQSGKNWKGKRE
ncbi:hypothetical protein QBC44DRAFT_312751 [Cladorrhinum sp. PSN332]|nr:hypothetical protein QBC44DRAFT_312751 [Cladorrhinum sp. PSN332]